MMFAAQDSKLPKIRRTHHRLLPSLVLGNRLLQILEPELQLLGRELLGPAAELVVRQALDQQAKLVVLGVQLALLMQDRAQHLLQQGGVVRQGVRVDLHGAMMNDDAASEPVFIVVSRGFSSGQFRSAGPHRCSPFAAIEQRGQLRRGQCDPARRGRRRPSELALLKPFRQHAQPDTIMPDQLDEPSPASTKGKDGAAERILRQSLLHEHGQACHTFPDVGHPTG
jgi:hypothetical protein